MISIYEYLLGKNKKLNTIYATDENIRQIVKNELDRLGHDADLNHIDVSKVTDMNSLFSCGKGDYLGQSYIDLNTDISKWDVSSVENMSGMFFYCQNFNKDITQWKVDKVTYMYNMFWYCKKFNQDLSDWDVSSVTDYSCVFAGCPIKEEYKPKFKK